MTVKRFIAGAVCQQCKAQDKLRAWEDALEKVMHRECVACGAQDKIALEISNDSELQTRVNYTDPVFEEDVTPVRMFLNDSDSSTS